MRLKTILSSAAVAIVLAAGWINTVVHADEKFNPTGLWKLTATTQSGQTFQSTLKLTQDGSKLTGIYTGPRGNEVAIGEAQIKDGTLSFGVSREVDGNKFTSKFQAKITGERIKGTIDFDFAGQTGTLDFDGTRAKEPVSLAGTWRITVKEDDGRTIERVVKWKQDGEKLSGLYSGPRLAEFAVEEVSLKDDELTFRVSREQNGNKMIFTYHGKVSGDSITGKMDYDVAGEQGTLPFEAKRVKEQVNAAGTWKFKITAESGQVFEPSLALTADGGELTGVYTGQLGETPAEQVKLDGSQLSFQVSRERDGRTYTMKYRGKIDGDTIKGTIDYDFDGQTGSIDFDGTRAKGEKN